MGDSFLFLKFLAGIIWDLDFHLKIPKQKLYRNKLIVEIRRSTSYNDVGLVKKANENLSR